MKRFFMNLKAVVATIAVTAVVSSSMVSCSQEFDDTKIWEEIENLKKEIALLREMVETELFALNELVNGLVTVKDVKSDKDGNKVVTLSDGTKITIYPKADEVPSNIVTTTTIDGVMYWAYYDGLGNAQPVVVNGKKVPVADVVPQTQVVDNSIQVSFDGGNTWMTTGYSESVADSIFSDIEVVYSDWQTDSEGNPLPLYCIFTMNDGSTMKVGMQSSRIVLPYDSIFVAYGSETPFTINIQDAADFMITTPKGWECDAKLDTKNERIYINFLAPTQQAIDAGSAVNEGVVKLMVVFNNGSSSIASIKVTCNPAVVHFTAKGVRIDVGYGTTSLLCGIMKSNEYKSSTMKGQCDKVLGGGESDYVYQASFAEKSSLFIEYPDLFTGKDLVAGSEYVFWYVTPRTKEDDTLYVVESELFPQKFTHSSVAFEVTEPSFFDVNIKFETVGSNDYMLDFCPAEEFDAAALATYYTENPDYLAAIHKQGEPYAGSFVELFNDGALLQYNTEYVAYYIAKPYNGIVIEENILAWEVKTNDFTSGGDIEVVVVGEPVVEYESIEMTLNSKNNNHIAMFYNAMPSNQATAYPNDESIIKMLTSKDAMSQISSEAIVARYEDAEPNTKLTFFAVAVDTEGKFGKPFKQEFTTKKLEYNDLAVTAELTSDYKINNTRIKLTCDGAASYRYMYIQTESDVWVDEFKKSVDKIGEYMLMYPNSGDVCNTSNEKYALVDGHIVLNGLEAGVEYIMVVMAVDAKGIVSKPVSCYFTPIADIGNVIYRDNAKWEESKPTVTILSMEDNPHLFMSFSWSCLPAPHTKVYTAALFPDNFINDEINKNVDTVEKLIAEIISNCDTGTMSEPGKSFEWQESGIYVREWVEWEDIDGDLYLDEVYKREERDAPYIFYPYGSNGRSFIYTTWVGEDGNFCEPFAIDPATEKEVELWPAEE